jgi:tRNA G18 (ribose-2'-O)-methylase SpoU
VLDRQAESIYAAQLENPRTAILLGSEQLGLSAESIALSDRRLTVPMPGMVRSLNLSVTAGVFLCELTRQRLLRGIEQYRYPQAEQQALADEFLKRGS